MYSLCYKLEWQSWNLVSIDAHSIAMNFKYYSNGQNTKACPGEFPTQRPVTRGFDVFFDLRLNKRMSKQSWGWWLETLSCSLWRQSNELARNCLWGIRRYFRIHFLMLNVMKSDSNFPEMGSWRVLLTTSRYWFKWWLRTEQAPSHYPNQLMISYTGVYPICPF